MRSFRFRLLEDKDEEIYTEDIWRFIDAIQKLYERERLGLIPARQGENNED